MKFNTLNLVITREFPHPFQRYALRGKDLIGVEIGVNAGNNSLSLLKGSSIKKLYLVDPYIEYENYKDYNIDKCERRAKRRLRKYKDKIVWVKKLSSEAVNDIPDNLDFVYIDGNHTYKYVKEDIENYWEKLKVGGLLAGHDFVEDETHTYGVIKAVTEFVNKKKLKLNVFGWDWWVWK